MSNTETETPDYSLILRDPWYSRIKWFALTVLPAFSALYFSLSPALGLPATEAVMGVCAALGVFIGTILGFSTKRYNNSGAKYSGAINIQTSADGDKLFLLELDGDPLAIENMSDVSFKVNSQLPPPTV